MKNIIPTAHLKVLSGYQNAALNEFFSTIQFPSREEIDHLAVKFNLTHNQVRKWFECQRAKVRDTASISNRQGENSM